MENDKKQLVLEHLKNAYQKTEKLERYETLWKAFNVIYESKRKDYGRKNPTEKESVVFCVKFIPENDRQCFYLVDVLIIS